MINKITRSLMDIMNKIKKYEILSVLNGNKSILIKDLLNMTLKQCQLFLNVRIRSLLPKTNNFFTQRD